MDERQLRRELPSRRETVRRKVCIGGRNLYLDVGFFEDGRPGEIFIVVEKSGDAERFLLDHVARMTSIAVQYGAPLDEIIDGWLWTKGIICGPVVGDPKVKMATSALDYCAKHVLTHYFGRKELEHAHSGD